MDGLKLLSITAVIDSNNIYTGNYMGAFHEYANGYNRAIEDVLNIIHSVMIERYGTHISSYDLLLSVKNKLIENSFKIIKEKKDE